MGNMNAYSRLEPYRRILQLALGVIWLLDAALQFQPYMFTRAFPQQVLAPVGRGNPGWVSRPVDWAAHLTASHVVIVNAVFATVQLLIALGLFTRSTVRLALAGSFMWALGVWWMGEGLGGILGAPQSPIMGAPGAAVIYALISILIWPRQDTGSSTEHATESVATVGLVRGTAPRLAWLLLWGGFAVESMQAANRSPAALHDQIAGMAAGESGWLRAVDNRFAILVAHHGTEVSIALAITFGFTALAVLGGTRLQRSGLLVAMAVAALIWLVGEGLGDITTGQATDPNSGVLLILLAAAYWPVTASDPRPRTSLMYSQPRQEMAAARLGTLADAK
jgi:hypothetical protein